MQILIFEDEPLAAAKIQKLILELNPRATILGILESVEEGIEWLQNNPSPDLILSDIQLNDGTCFRIYSSVAVNCPVIFTTAYEKYAIQAFEVNSIDYLLKPIQKERLANAIKKVKSLEMANAQEKIRLFEEVKRMLGQAQKEYKSRFLCKLGNKIKSIPVDAVKYFVSKDKLTFIVDANDKSTPVNYTLDEIEHLINPKQFFRVNRKYLVHFEAISEIAPYFKGRLKLQLLPDAKEDIVVSSEKSPLFKAWLNQ